MAEIVNETPQDMPQDVDNQAEEEQIEEQKQLFDLSKRNELKTKPIPAITTLLAAAVVSIVTYVNKYPLLKALILILIFMVVFLIIGDIIKFVVDRFIIESEKEILSEGEVIEKNPEDIEETEDGE